MIDYSLGARNCNPSDKNSEKKVYAYAQAREVIDIMALASHIQLHGSPYTRDIIVGVLTKGADCIREDWLWRHHRRGRPWRHHRVTPRPIEGT